jgi:hypothetical protein
MAQRGTSPDPFVHTRRNEFQAFLTLLLALPSLALRDPKLHGGELGAKPKFDMIFMLLGVIAIPMWVPHVGTLVLTFTLVIPSEPPWEEGAGMVWESCFACPGPLDPRCMDQSSTPSRL